jgi:hypothetical protein
MLCYCYVEEAQAVLVLLELSVQPGGSKAKAAAVEHGTAVL